MKLAVAESILAALMALAWSASAADTNATEEVSATNALRHAALTNALPKKAAVASSPDKWKISTRLFKLNHASASEVAEKFNTTWVGDFGQSWKVAKMAVAFEESNIVMVTAPGSVLDACADAIRQLDVEAPQVYIEARFVELSNNVYRDLGIDWSMLDGMKGSVNLSGGIESHKLGDGVQNYLRSTGGSQYERTEYNLTGKDGDISFFNGTLSFTEMYLLLYALEGNEDARIFSNPKIIVSSGKKAIVDMTTKYPNVSIAAKRTQNGNSDSLDLDMKMTAIPGEDKMMFAKEAFFSWGISLEVIPRIGTNGLINVTIVPTISDQSDWVTAGTSSQSADDSTVSARYPVIDVQRLITEFNMASGTTAVIGGLSRTVEEQVDRGIPYLSKIPWIGDKLFGGKKRGKTQKEIIVFVTVGLVDPKNMAKDAGLPKNAILGRQYTKGQKLEPGDLPEKNMHGQDSLDNRSLDEQAKDPLRQNVPQKGEFKLSDYVPFVKDPNYHKNNNHSATNK